jgi:biotin transport system substrate-specific component
VQQAQSLTLADAVFPRVNGDSRIIAAVRNVALMAGFAAFVALFAQLQVRLPWTPVPVTGQTFAVLVTGGALGAWRGAGSLTLYGLAGAFGLPVFTPATATTSGSWDVHLFLPWQGSHGVPWELASGGYILGFILAAAAVGFLAERGWDRGAWVHVAMLLGSAIVYVPGVLWLRHELHVSLSRSLELGLYPFIPGDLMKLLLAATVLPSAWVVVSNKQRATRNTERGAGR